MSRVKVFAHRGFHEAARENTLEAIQAATDIGAHGVEVDVRLTADGQAVLFHDPLAPGGAEVAGMTRAELCRAAGHDVPTLESALGSFGDLEWDIEIKCPGALDETARVLTDRPGGTRVVVTSFNYLLALRAGKRARVPFGVIHARRPILPVFLFDKVKPAVVVWRLGAASREDLEMLRSDGIATYLYGPTTAEHHRRCLELAPDAVITDTPWRLLGGPQQV